MAKPPRHASPITPSDTLIHPVELVRLADLRPHPQNYVDHPPEQLTHLEQSVTTHGLYKNVVIAQDGTILAGRGTVEACRNVGYDSIAVTRLPYAPDDPRAIQVLVGDNEQARLKVTDEAALARLLLELQADDPLRLLGTGFDTATLAELAAAQGMLRTNGNGSPDLQDVEPQIDRAEELRQKWGVELGHLWQLGEHRVLCGDCTDPPTVQQLMGRDYAQLVITDPPYGVSYADKNTFLNTIGRANRIEKPITNDHVSKADIQALWKASFTCMSTIMVPGAVIYCFMPQGGDQMMMMMMMMMEGAGIEPRHELIWLKNNHVLGRVDYAYKHEPILYAWKDGGHKFYGDFQTSILEFPKPQHSDLHPTTKPLALIARLMANSSRAGDIVYDGFVGSGTTILACEQLARLGRVIEIDPGYVAVTLQRWADLTGRTPTRIE